MTQHVQHYVTTVEDKEQPSSSLESLPVARHLRHVRLHVSAFYAISRKLLNSFQVF
jgi:hypothetical protein